MAGSFGAAAPAPNSGAKTGCFGAAEGLFGTGAKTKFFSRRPLHGHPFARRRYFNPKHPQIPLWIKLRFQTAPPAASSLTGSMFCDCQCRSRTVRVACCCVRQPLSTPKKPRTRRKSKSQKARRGHDSANFRCLVLPAPAARAGRCKAAFSAASGAFVSSRPLILASGARRHGTGIEVRDATRQAGGGLSCPRLVLKAGDVLMAGGEGVIRCGTSPGAWQSSSYPGGGGTGPPSWRRELVGEGAPILGAELLLYCCRTCLEAREG